MTIDLTGSDRSLLVFEAGDVLAQAVSPRPYLHPICTPAGTLLTEIAPADHPHHLGLSLALPDVNGNHFWGGKTYVPRQGYVWEGRHGRQRLGDVRLDRPSDEDGPGPVMSARRLACAIDWIGVDGRTLLTESRSIIRSGVRLGATTAAVLSWRSVITPRRDTTISSPGAKGRRGAGYGGVFWRFPGRLEWTVFSPEATGEEHVNGSRVDWVAMRTAASPGQRDEAIRPAVTVVLRQHGPRVPWFVRTREYPGVCPALAWQEQLRLPGGRPFAFGLEALIVDDDLTTVPQVERALAEAG